MDPMHGPGKLTTMKARTRELQTLIPGANVATLLWWARKHYTNPVGITEMVERMIDDPAGNGGETFSEFADQLVIFATALRAKTTA